MPPIIPLAYAKLHPVLAARGQVAILLEKVKLSRMLPLNVASRWLRNKGIVIGSSAHNLAELCRVDIFESAEKRPRTPSWTRENTNRWRWYVDGNEALKYLRLSRSQRIQIHRGRLYLSDVKEADLRPLADIVYVPPEETELVPLNEAIKVLPVSRTAIHDLAYKRIITCAIRPILGPSGWREAWYVSVEEARIYFGLTKGEKMRLAREGLTVTALLKNREASRG